jgi:holliday junction DNA helicase RuvA
MIALLKGTVEARLDPYLIIDVNGVGYKVLPAHSVLSKLNGVGENIKVYTYTHVREDILELYGFAEPDDLRLFEYLISVSGIGPKSAIGIFTVGSRHDIIKAILNGDTTFFTAVPRLGKKNAQKLIIELKSKLGSTEEFDLSSPAQAESDDVVAALKGFGFSSSEAITALRSITQDGLSTSDKIRLALKYLGK